LKVGIYRNTLIPLSLSELNPLRRATFYPAELWVLSKARLVTHSEAPRKRPRVMVHRGEGALELDRGPHRAEPSASTGLERGDV